MASRIKGETEAHLRLKRLALIWAQSNGYRACATEVALPRSRYRADVAAYRPTRNRIGLTAIFECKQSPPDLRRDSCSSDATRRRLATIERRRAVLERCLRVHFPSLRRGESLFAEFDSYEFETIGHRGYTRLLRERAALQAWLFSGTKFETLLRYRCANVCYIVATPELAGRIGAPGGWGVLVENGDELQLACKPQLQDCSELARLEFLERIAAAATRQTNRQHGVDREMVVALRQRNFYCAIG